MLLTLERSGCKCFIQALQVTFMYNDDTGHKILRMMSDDRSCNLTEFIMQLYQIYFIRPYSCCLVVQCWEFYRSTFYHRCCDLGNPSHCMACQTIRRLNETRVLNENTSAAF